MPFSPHPLALDMPRMRPFSEITHDGSGGFFLPPLILCNASLQILEALAPAVQVLHHALPVSRGLFVDDGIGAALVACDVEVGFGGVADGSGRGGDF